VQRRNRSAISLMSAHDFVAKVPIVGKGIIDFSKTQQMKVPSDPKEHGWRPEALLLDRMLKSCATTGVSDGQRGPSLPWSIPCEPGRERAVNRRGADRSFEQKFARDRQRRRNVIRLSRSITLTPRRVDRLRTNAHVIGRRVLRRHRSRDGLCQPEVNTTESVEHSC
jgi:hypothetical protein